MEYRQFINEISSEIPDSIIDLKAKRKRGTAPTQAFSDFLTHAEQGDWAETLFFNALKTSSIPYVPVKYGRSEKIIAGDPRFKEFYNAYQDELDSIGKRPDVLLFNPADYDKTWGEDVAAYSLKDLIPIVKKAVAGFEVRSSAYLTRKFKPKDDKPFLSFTPKVEDLLVVLKWINTFNVPHYYVQVFFDAMYIISFKDILILLRDAQKDEKGIKNKKIIGSIKGKPAFVIEKNPKNQFKETIHIFLNSGYVLYTGEINPTLIASKKELASGRLLHYVTFEGGTVNLDIACLMGLIQKPF